jgi:hypothetical protein
MSIALALTLLFAGMARASTPTGGQYGPWHVTSISSLSGVGGDDAMALIVQENEAGRIEMVWLQDSDVVISFRVEACGADGDFLRTYNMSPARWAHRAAPALARRLESEFVAWRAEARRTCRDAARLDAFRFDALAAALADFTERLRYLASIR